MVDPFVGLFLKVELDSLPYVVITKNQIEFYNFPNRKLPAFLPIWVYPVGIVEVHICIGYYFCHLHRFL